MKNAIHRFLNKLNLNVRKVNPRGFDRFLIKHYSTPLSGIEVGVYEGDHMAYLLKKGIVEKIWGIDSYKNWGEYDTKDKNRFCGTSATSQIVKAEGIARRKLSKFGDKAVIIKEDSDKACADFKPESVDFVYLDAGHSYEQVKKDIKNYYPLVRKGGMLGGDDFDNGVYSQHKGIIPAVLQFVNEHNLKLYVDKLDWWVVKPRLESKFKGGWDKSYGF